MPTVDLSAPRARALDPVAALPRRLTLTLPELELVARRAGGAPLPFDPPGSAPVTGGGLESRLGGGGADRAAEAWRAARDGLHDPLDSLERRGLLEADAEGALEPGLAGAVGLLATPTLALDLDVVVDGRQVRAWHRQGPAGVASLATADGLVFEIAWFATSAWATELGRVAAPPQDLGDAASALPDLLDLPFELLDASGEAYRTRRPDVVGVLVANHAGRVVADGRVVPEAQVPGLLAALGQETQGRLRALVTEVGDGDTGAPRGPVGVTSWLLLADGWHALRPHTTDGEARVEVRRVAPGELGTTLAPVLAEVVR